MPGALVCEACAEQIRRSLDAVIPDCAWVPRGSMKAAFKADATDRTTLRGTTTITFTEPWQWYEAKVTLGPKP